MITRRTFLTALAATAVLDPERLLWIPGERRIFIPRPPIRWKFDNAILNTITSEGFPAGLTLHRGDPDRPILQGHSPFVELLNWRAVVPTGELIATKENPIYIESPVSPLHNSAITVVFRPLDGRPYQYVYGKLNEKPERIRAI